MKEKDKKEIKSEEEKPKGIRISVVFGYREPVDLKILEHLEAEFSGGLSKSGVIKKALYDHFFGNTSHMLPAEKPVAKAPKEKADDEESPSKSESTVVSKSPEEEEQARKIDALGDAF